MTPNPVLGYQLYFIYRSARCEDMLHQTRVLYEKWEDMLEAAAVLAATYAHEYIEIIEKADDTSMEECITHKATKLYILMDQRNTEEEYGAVWVCPLFSERHAHPESGF